MFTYLYSTSLPPYDGSQTQKVFVEVRRPLVDAGVLSGCETMPAEDAAREVHRRTGGRVRVTTQRGVLRTEATVGRLWWPR